MATSTELKFVEVSRAIHEEMLTRATDRAQQLHEVSTTFSTMLHNGAPAEQLIIQAARLLRAPVVLEDNHHRVIYYSEGHHVPSALLESWGSHSSRLASHTGRIGTVVSPTVAISMGHHDGAQAEATTIQHTCTQRWLIMDVQSRGTCWGRLSAMLTPQSPRELSVCEHILRNTAIALAVERSTSSNPHGWTDLAERNCARLLLGRRFVTHDGAATVLDSAGFRTRDRQLMSLVVRCPNQNAFTPDVVERLRGRARPLVDGGDILAVVTEHQALLCVLSTPRSTGNCPDHMKVAQELSTQLTSLIDAPVHTVVGPMTTDIGELMRLMRQLVEIGAQPLHATSSGLRRGSKTRAHSAIVVPLAHSPMDALINQLGDDVRVQEFVSTTLQPLIEHDDHNKGDLINTLRAVVAHPTSRKAAADALHLSRTALYARIETIERLTGLDLSDGGALFSLSLALRAYGAH